MENSVKEEESIIEVKEITPSQPEKRNPRRRLIQSTLFPHKSPKKEEEDNSNGEDEDDDDEYCGSQSKNKRKRKGKAQTKRTPPNKAPIKGQEAASCRAENGNFHPSNGSEFFLKVSERKLQQKQQKEQGGAGLLEENSKNCADLEPVASKRSRRQVKKQGDASPAKNLTPSKLKGVSPAKKLTPSKSKGAHCRRLPVGCDADTTNNVGIHVDLWLEAKKAAEENARLFTGKQTHPFFSSRKTGQKTQGTLESIEPASKRCLVLQDESIGPIHVMEDLKDDPMSLDWRNWIFCDEAIFDSVCAPETAHVSVFEDSIQPLKFDDFHTISDPIGSPTGQNDVAMDFSSIQVKDTHPDSQTVSSANGQVCHLQVPITKINTESQDRFIQERMESYSFDRGNHHDRLWTDKYQPEKASEVCGNNESVRFLSEWLGSWRERYSQTCKTSTNNNTCVSQDIDYSWNESDSDAESIDGRDNLKNVLLVTGPVGSGKSAAIYACAKEQGFQVIEVSASDWRNGAHVKQKFGEAATSLGLNQWSPGLRKRRILESFSTQFSNPSIQVLDDDINELEPVTCKEQSGNVEHGSPSVLVKSIITVSSGGADKTLILFEDVDTIFDEDRGFIAAVQQIAETAKRPMILTSNSEDPVLPSQLDRLEVCFETPSHEELLSHVYMVCAAEKVKMQPQLVDRFISFCQGDIRKTVMMLQFWCQGKMKKKDRKLQFAYGVLQFDLDAGHSILPKVIPWDFPCQLSKLVEEEITKSLSMMREKASLLDVVEEEELSSQEVQDLLEMGIEAKKDAMLSRNYSIYEDTGFSTQFNNVAAVSNSSGSPVAFTRRIARRGPTTVFSSHSGDELCRDDAPVNLNIHSGDIGNEVLPVDSSTSHVHGVSFQDYPKSSTELLHLSERKTSEQDLYNCFQTRSDQNIFESYKSLDLSCVPESSFVSETLMNGVELQSRTISCGCVSHTLEAVPLSTIKSFEGLPIMDATNPHKALPDLNRSPETTFRNSCDGVGESFQVDEEVGDSHTENGETLPKGYQVMDECSRADFNLVSISGADPTCLVQERWRRLRNSRTNLTLYVTSEQKEACQIVKLASRMTDLISTADLMLGCCQSLISDFSEPSMLPSAELDTFGWHDEQIKMSSTVAEHGFCLFAKECTLRGSNLGFENRVDLAQEMLASTTNTTVLGKLVTQEGDMNQGSFARSSLENGTPICNSLARETEARLFDMIQNVVPSKLYLALKGAPFHEYVSTLGQISKLEASRLSANISDPKSRRTRAARHYLSTGSLSLSPEDVSFLAKRGCYGKNSLE